ncbi:MAG: hypothetical protein IKC18_02135 [Bacteroidaceae bacterium]|nr:hypothetical protein [Bacteroidaceae bacterium]
MTNLNDKTIRLRLIERYLAAETSPVEERFLTEYYLANPDCAEPDERNVRDLILALHLTKADKPFQMSEEKERLFDELMPLQPGYQRSRKRILYASVAAIAAVLSAVCFLLLRPARSADGADITQITEVADGQVYTESQIDAAIKSDIVSGRQQKMLDVCDFYQQAAILFPDCDQVKLEKKGNVILLTASQNDSTHRYYVISTADTSGTTYQMTQLYIGE